MKTLLHYIALFVLHFAFSLLFNLIFGEIRLLMPFLKIEAVWVPQTSMIFKGLPLYDSK